MFLLSDNGLSIEISCQETEFFFVLLHEFSEIFYPRGVTIFRVNILLTAVSDNNYNLHSYTEMLSLFHVVKYFLWYDW